MNVDTNKAAAAGLGIRSIPTIKVFNSGEVVDTKVGALNENQINEMIGELIHG